MRLYCWAAQAAGPAPGMHGPSWGIVGRNMYFCTVMYRSLSLDSGLPVPVYHVHRHYAQKYLLFPHKTLNAFWYLLCSKLCQHNPPRPTEESGRFSAKICTSENFPLYGIPFSFKCAGMLAQCSFLI